MKFLITFLIITSWALAQPVTIYTTSIDSAASVTDTLDLFDIGLDVDTKLIGIAVDTAWTDADLTFLVGDAKSGGVLYEMQEMDGTAVTCDVDSTFDNYFALKPILFAGVRYIQIRSGTRGTPVAQGDTRTIKLFVREY